jgi:hypothetical protein
MLMVMLSVEGSLVCPSPSLSPHATKTPRITVADPESSALDLSHEVLNAWGYKTRN